jgi:hypothetical protein
MTSSVIPDHAFVRNLVYTWNHVSSCELSSCLLKGPERTEMERHVLFTLLIIYSSNTIKGSVLPESYIRTPSGVSRDILNEYY